MEDTHSYHLGLFFDEDWNRHDSEQSFGHDIEASWLLMKTALVLGDKHWWVQAEFVIGQIYLYRFHGIENAAMIAAQTWDYIKRNIVDYDGGEWFWSRNADGSVNRTDDKSGFWKCPYHNSRMCLEVYSILGEM